MPSSPSHPASSSAPRPIAATALSPHADRLTSLDAVPSAFHAAPLAHRARHDPALLGNASAAAEKSRLLAAIASAPRASAARRALYHELHVLLAAARAAAPDRLAAFDAHAAAAASSRATLQLLADRTFPFPFHSAAALRALAEAILARFRV